LSHNPNTLASEILKEFSEKSKKSAFFTSRLYSNSVFLFKHFTFSCKCAIILDMTGETLTEMAEWSKELQRTIERRVQRAGIKPLTRQALYPIGTYEKIKDPKMGRPKKETAPKNKTKPKKK
jgi:hypothetical protein